MQPQESPIYDSRPPLSLPPELILIILEYVWNREQSYKNLCQCSLVCRRWRSMAQELIFTEVSLYGRATTQSFLSAIQTNPSLGSATKSLELQIGSHSFTPSWPHQRVLPETAYAVTSRCPCLYRLNLTIPSSLDTSLQTSLLNPHTFMTLRALDLSMYSAEQGFTNKIYITDLFQFLHQFVALSHLHMRIHSGKMLRSSDASPSLPPPPSFHLVEFACPTMPTTEAFKLVTDWLFPKSSDSLCILELPMDRINWNDVRHFISNHGKNLVSLRLFLDDDVASLKLLNLPEACPSLQEIILADLGNLPQEVRSALPTASLEFLRIPYTRGDEKEIEEVIDWIRSLPNFRCFTLGRGWSYRVLEEKWRKLAPERVDLVWKMDVFDYKSEDLVLPIHFPRGKTMETLRLMHL
ncbi:hypothetical protein FRC02_011539 [Tulasnella sp. 418]|nr:hypothetical protein FRC02_011539 [Tulasnella sp. 418]